MAKTFDAGDRTFPSVTLDNIYAPLESLEALTEEVDEIIRCGGDPEGAHGMEDDLHLAIIRKFCPPWVVSQVNRLDVADFPRWRA